MRERGRERNERDAEQTFRVSGDLFFMHNYRLILMLEFQLPQLSSLQIKVQQENGTQLGKLYYALCTEVQSDKMLVARKHASGQKHESSSNPRSIVMNQLFFSRFNF